MPEPKQEVEERLTVRSTLAAIAVAVVDHRVLFQVAVVGFSIFALRTWGPEDINRGIDYVAASAPVRGVARVVGEVWAFTTGGLQAVDRVTHRAGIAPSIDPSAPSIQVPSVVGTPAAPVPKPGPGSPRPAATSSSPPPIAPTGVATTPLPLSSDAGGSTAALSGDSLLWSVAKDRDTIRAEVHAQGGAGADLVLFRNGKVWRRERWADAATARAEAERKRVELEKLGWVRLPND